MKRILFITLLLLATTASAQQSTSLTQAFESAVMDTTGEQTDVVVLYLLERNSIQTSNGAQQLVQTVNGSRNDLHLTASSSAPGSVAIAEKTAIADILAIALERGALTEETQGTNVTLSTTPYAAATLFGAEDTPRNWQALRPLRRVAIQGTFSSDAVVREGDFSTFVAGGLKFLLIGNRSPRDAAIVTRQAAALREQGVGMDARINRNVTCEALVNSAWGKSTFTPAVDTYGAWLDQNPRASRDARVAKLKEFIPDTTLDAETTVLVANCGEAQGAISKAEDAELTLVKTIADDYLKYNTKHQLSFTTLYQRDPATTNDFLTLKLLYGNDLIPSFRTNLNAQIDLNAESKTAAGAALDRIRAYSVEGSMTLGPFGQNRFTSDFSGKWYRDQNVQQSVVVLQGILNLKVSGTMNLPVGVSYATQSVNQVQKGFQVNLGVAVLLDQILMNNSAR